MLEFHCSKLNHYMQFAVISALLQCPTEIPSIFPLSLSVLLSVRLCVTKEILLYIRFNLINYMLCLTPSLSRITLQGL